MVVEIFFAYSKPSIINTLIIGIEKISK